MYEDVLYSGSCFVLSLLVESQKILFSKIRTTLTVTKDYVYGNLQKLLHQWENIIYLSQSLEGYITEIEQIQISKFTRI